ncbi:HET-domain-containing protein [Epithele typhae]|uniref:HET-domain-containing protein n=1 Tax=Epithele typhae TaxID=378194 RepID=UPI002007AC08|nr:HET-domain-containing protein [Epithele typhae]KAH9924989.1 HET-domain-containing protein [Epithele typhae]
MWLLNTSTAELRFFHSPSGICYAILSHVWGEHEQTFQELQALRSSFHSPDGTPRSRASFKIRDCCMYAEKAGYAWVWIDTCCIDKTSSAELSEAINSMYVWYARADVCYALLDDVPGSENPVAHKSCFRHARWWTRGWTLQELIAPRTLVFVSHDWRFLGTKHSLASVVEEISGVDRAVLVHSRALDDISVARRMSWAASRVTTREEDRAYSLMGIFGVTMPTIYGEGQLAFTRLQDEILKLTPDQSIFAWGPVLESYPYAFHGFAADLDEPHHRASHNHTSQPEMQTMLAPSPAEFAAAGRIRPITTLELSLRLGVDLSNPHYQHTSYGIRTRLPLLTDSHAPGELPSLTAPTKVSLAALACEHEDGSLVLLFLRKKDSAHDEYYVGDFVDVGDGGALFTRAYYRIAFLAPSTPSGLSHVDVQDVYVHTHAHPALRLRLPQRLPQGKLTDGLERVVYAFVFPEWVLARLRAAGFVPTSLPPSPNSRPGSRPRSPPRTDADGGLTLEMPVLPGLDVSAIFRLARVATVAFRHRDARRPGFTVVLGLGCICQLAQNRRGFDAFWLDVVRAPVVGAAGAGAGGSAGQSGGVKAALGRAGLHQRWSGALGASGTCTRQHLGHTSMEFGGADGRVRLTVTPWGDAPSGPVARYNYVVDLELLGPEEVAKVGEGEPAPVEQLSLLRRVVEVWMTLGRSE